VTVDDRRSGGEQFARWVFGVAGVYGLAVLVPQYFLEDRIGRDSPPPITHPEHFYGFLGVAVAWQVAFLLIAREPTRLRPVMLAAVLEKLSFAIAAAALFANGRVAAAVFAFGLVDLCLGCLFVVAFAKTLNPR
jgi:hypothetical protein